MICSRVGEQSRNGSCCTNKTAIHNSISNDQRSYSGSWVHSPQSHNEPYVRSGAFSLSYRKSHCTFYTNYNFDHTVRTFRCISYRLAPLRNGIFFKDGYFFATKVQNPMFNSIFFDVDDITNFITSLQHPAEYHH